MLRMMLPWLPFETTDGHATLEEFARTHRTVLVHLAASRSSGRSPRSPRRRARRRQRRLHLRPRAGRTGCPTIRPGTIVAELDPATVTAHLDPVDPADGAGRRRLPGRGPRRRSTGFDCDVVLRAFQPALRPRAPPRRPRGPARTHPRRSARGAGRTACGRDILGSLRRSAPRAQLVLNHLNPLVRTRRHHRRARAGRHQRRSRSTGRPLLSRAPAAGPPTRRCSTAPSSASCAHALRKDS